MEHVRRQTNSENTEFSSTFLLNYGNIFHIFRSDTQDGYDAADQRLRWLQDSHVLRRSQPPHCHIDSADYAALVSIENAAVFEGAIDLSFRKEALAWVAENKSFLMGKLNELHPG